MNFPDWYAAHVKPQLEETLKNMPVPAREALRTASRQAMAACWNAAIDECQKHTSNGLGPLKAGA